MTKRKRSGASVCFPLIKKCFFFVVFFVVFFQSCTTFPCYGPTSLFIISSILIPSIHLQPRCVSLYLYISLQYALYFCWHRTCTSLPAPGAPDGLAPTAEMTNSPRRARGRGGEVQRGGREDQGLGGLTRLVKASLCWVGFGCLTLKQRWWCEWNPLCPFRGAEYDWPHQASYRRAQGHQIKQGSPYTCSLMD